MKYAALALLALALVWGLLYSLRWNDSDEQWLHRHGECTHSGKGCPPEDDLDAGGPCV